MAKFRKEFEGDNGWTRWIPPRMTGYKLACCDCGLVHDTQFKVLRVTKRNKDGSWEGVRIAGTKVLFRVRRNDRSTAAMRTADKKRAKKP